MRCGRLLRFLQIYPPPFLKYTFQNQLFYVTIYRFCLLSLEYLYAYINLTRIFTSLKSHLAFHRRIEMFCDEVPEKVLFQIERLVTFVTFQLLLLLDVHVKLIIGIFNNLSKNSFF